MKLKLKSSALKSSALLLSGLMMMGISSAQEIKTSLPMTNIGSNLAWSVGDQKLALDVPVTGRVRLELYSAHLDQKDYRSDNYYGDEQYDGNRSAVSTTFTLRDSAGNIVQKKTYMPGKHNWETFFDQNLSAGKYQIQVTTEGDGKNTFALRLAGQSAAISADVLTVNVHSQEWLAAVNVNTDGPGYVLRMYDGDGATELEARLRDAAGNIYPVKVGGDLQWSDIPLPDAAGHYTIELRQPQHTKQYSNTVGFALTRQGTAAPITLSQVDQTGLLKVDAELVLPTGTFPTQVGVGIQGPAGTQNLSVNSHMEEKVTAGDYALSVQPVVGATTSIDKALVNVPKNGVGQAKIQVRPQVALSLSTDKPEICMGDVVNVVARATTDYQGVLPLNLQLAAQGLTLKGEQPDTMSLKPGEKAEWHFEATATQPGTYSLSANLPDWQQQQQASVKVLPNTTALQLRRAALSDSRVGDTVTVKLTLTNTSNQEVPFKLTDTPGAGLQATGTTSFSGTLKAGEVRELSYQAKVVASGLLALNAQLDTPSCPMPQQSQGTLNVVSNPAPTAERRSTITLPFDVPRQADELIITHHVPADSSYVAGSSKMDGVSIPDPAVGSKGTLYWVVPAQLKGTLSYDLAHTAALGELPKPALMIRMPGDRSEVLQGQVDKTDLATALRNQKRASVENLDDTAENVGAIKLPHDNRIVRIRDRINVVVEYPSTGTAPVLMVNGKAMGNDLIGETTQDGPRGVTRLTYVGVPIVPGPNTMQYGDSTIHVMKVGPAAQVELEPIKMIADGSTPVRLRVKVKDAYGNPATVSMLTVRPSLEPNVTDADTGASGYQIAIVDGEGELSLSPQSAPTALDLAVEVSNTIKTFHYQVTPDLRPVGVGMLSATVGLNSDFGISSSDNWSWQGRLYSENPIGHGKLYVAADKDGLPHTDDLTPLHRYSVYGDASTEQVPLQGIDPIAAVYDHPAFQLAYRRMQMPVDVLPVGEQFTAFTGTTKGNLTVSGFAAYVPTDLIRDQVFMPTGSRILNLRPNIAAGSETLQLVTYDNSSLNSSQLGKELSRRLLVRNVDYILDESTGIVTLVTPQDPFDYNYNAVRILASYRIDDGKDNREWAYGAQIKQKGDNYTVAVGGVHLDGVNTFGVRGTYDKDETHGNVAVAYASGLQAHAEFSTSWANRWGHKNMAMLSANYQSEEYNGIAPFNVGFNMNAKYVANITSNLVGIAEAEYHNKPRLDTVTNTLTDPNQPDNQGGSITLRGDYHLDPFSVGAGMKYAFGDIYGVGLVGSVGYHKRPWDLDVVHTQPLTGNLNTETVFSARYRITDNVSLGLKDDVVWGIGQAVTLALDAAIGNVNYAIGYELPNASGTGNRARFGVSTTLPLNNYWSVGLHAAALYDVAASELDGAAGADFNYKSDNYSATFGGDVIHNAKGWGTVIRGGITGSLTRNLVLTADGLAEFGAGQDGSRLNFGYAYRGRNFISLGYLRYINGILAGNNPEVTAGLSAEYRRVHWAVRAGTDTRYLINDSDSFSAQSYLAGKVYFNDYLAAGAWGYWLSQPATDTNLYGYGVEGSVRPLPGLWLNLGYNFKGFDGLNIPNIYTRKGAYFRVDLTLDDNEVYDQRN